MAANFISEMVSHNDTPSEELVGTLSVVSISAYLEKAVSDCCIVGLHRDPLLRHYCHLTY